MLLGGTLILIWGFIFQDNFLLKVPLFIHLALLCYAGAFSMFFKVPRYYANAIYFSLCTIAILHHIYLSEVNNFNSYFLVSFMLVISIASLVIFNIKYVIMMVILPISYMVYNAIKFPDEPHILMMIALASISVVIIYSSIFRAKLMRRIEKNHRLIEKQREGAVQNAKMAALGEMSSGMAHEINNPLAIILGNTQTINKLIEENPLDKEKIHYRLSAISDTVKRTQKIVDGLRAFSRDSSQDPFIDTDLKSIIDDTLSLCHSEILSFGIEFETNLLSENILINCRHTQISQVLLNLVSNAKDAVKDLTSKWIHLTVERQGEIVLIRISDSGAGITQKIQEKLFQPFFTTKEVGLGTGLGLSISQGIIEAHNGFIKYNVTSPHTEFIIGLPITSSSFETK